MATKKTAATDERTSAFLDVEEVARGLAARLARLDEEANRYSASASSLSEAAQATRDLADSVRNLGADAARAIEVVGSVGGPEIVRQLAAVDARIASLHAELAKKVGLGVNLAGAAAALALVAVVVAVVK